MESYIETVYTHSERRKRSNAWVDVKFDQAR